jgi:hypothetical protein
MAFKVRDIHNINQGILREVMGPKMGDNIGIFSFHLGQILMWAEHTIRFTVFKVEVTKI